MTEKEFDKLALESMINLYNTIDGQIKVLGEDIVRQHVPGLIQRREVVKGYVRNYATLYFEGMAYSDHMSVEEIEATLITGITK